MYVRLNSSSGMAGYRGLGDAYADQLATIQNSLGPLMSSDAMSALMARLANDRQSVFGLSTIIGMAQNGNNNSGASATLSNLANLLSQDPNFASVYYSGLKRIGSSNAYLFPNGDVVQCDPFNIDLCIQDQRNFAYSASTLQNQGGLKVIVYSDPNSVYTNPYGNSPLAAPPTQPTNQTFVQPFMPSWAQTPAQAPAAPPVQPVYVPLAPEMTQPASQPAMNMNVMQAAPQNQLYQPSPLITPPSPAGPASAGALPAAAATSSGSGVLDSAMSWISANPMLAAAGALGALFLFGGMGGRR